MTTEPTAFWLAEALAGLKFSGVQYPAPSEIRKHAMSMMRRAEKDNAAAAKDAENLRAQATEQLIAAGIGFDDAAEMLASVPRDHLNSFTRAIQFETDPRWHNDRAVVLRIYDYLILNRFDPATMKRSREEVDSMVAFFAGLKPPKPPPLPVKKLPPPRLSPPKPAR